MLHSQGPGAISKLHAPSSRLSRPKPISNVSVKNGWSKHSEAKQSTHLTGAVTKNSRLPKTTTAGGTVKQSTLQRISNQPKSKLALPTALKKKKTVATEKPTAKELNLQDTVTSSASRYMYTAYHRVEKF